MKTKEQVLKHLLEVGYTKEAIDRICGFMIAKGLKGVDEKITYKIGNNDFKNFNDWYNTFTCTCDIVLGNAFKDLVSALEEACSDDNTQEAKYVPKVGEFFYVRADSSAFGYIACKNNTENYHDNADKITSFSVAVATEEDFCIIGGNGCIICEDDGIVAIRPATNKEIERLKRIAKEEYGLEWNGEKWVKIAHEYKAGDYARVVKKSCNWNICGDMDYLLGRIIKIKDISQQYFIVMEEDEITNSDWIFTPDSLEPSTEEAYKAQCKKDKKDNIQKEFGEYFSKDVYRPLYYFFNNNYNKLDEYTQKVYAKAMLEVFAQWRNSIDAKDGDEYYLLYSSFSKRPIVGCRFFKEVSAGEILFNAKESAQLAIEYFGEDFIKKALV